MPKRIQRKRTKGWRMPEGAIYVGRPTKWGNPFMAETADEIGRAVEDYADWMDALIARGYNHDFSELRGHDLACWCPLDAPCHADVLLKLANRTQDTVRSPQSGPPSDDVENR